MHIAESYHASHLKAVMQVATLIQTLYSATVPIKESCHASRNLDPNSMPVGQWRFKVFEERCNVFGDSSQLCGA